jgi:hypothetical protein
VIQTLAEVLAEVLAKVGGSYGLVMSGLLKVKRWQINGWPTNQKIKRISARRKLAFSRL